MNREMLVRHTSSFHDNLLKALADPIEAQGYLEAAIADYIEDKDMAAFLLAIQDIIRARGSVEPLFEILSPVYGERLDFITKTLPVLSDPEEIAQSRKQEILHLTLGLAGDIKTAASIDFVGNSFINLQKLINKIRMVLLNANSVTEAIKSEMQMSLLQIGEGSFDIRLVSTPTSPQLGLFDNSDSGDVITIGDTIEEFVQLLNTGDNEDKLRERLKRLKSKVEADYVSFLKSLNESVTGTKFSWTSPNPSKGATAELSNTEIRKAIEILERFQEEERSTHTIIGELIAMSFPRKTFAIKPTEGKPYSGKIPEETIKTVEGVRMNQIYTARIRQVDKKSETTDETTKTEYYLISLKEIVR